MTARTLIDYVSASVVRAAPGEHFALASGRTTDWYADLRSALLSDGRAMRLAAEALYGRLPTDVETIGGVPTGGLTLLGALLPLCDANDDPSRPPRRGFYVRTAAKAHGMGRRVEGHPQGVACLVEDTVTSGMSSVENALAAREEGADVRYVLAMLDREEGAAETLRSHGLVLVGCITASMLRQGA